MAMGNSDDFEKKISRIMRDFTRAALEDENKPKYDLEELDDALHDLVDDIPAMVGQIRGPMYSALLKMQPEQRSEMINKALTGNRFRPVMSLKIEANIERTDFIEEAIVALPGYIQLHEAARRMDVAIDVAGLTSKEKGIGQPRLVIDTLKSYEEGQLKTTYGYPESVPPEQEEKPSAAEVQSWGKPPRGVRHQL